MTVIVGVEYKGGVILGGDSALTDDFHLGRTTLTEPKVWQEGDWGFGSCGSWRLSQLLRHVLTVPSAPDHADELDRFLALQFADAVRATLLESGTVYSKNAIEEMHNSNFLFAVRGRLYCMEYDFSVFRSQAGYMATGCGMDFALGVLHATKGLKPETRVKKALEAACAHNAGCMAPFTILDIPG